MDRAPLLTLVSASLLAFAACDNSRGGLVPSLGEASALSALSNDPVTVQLFWADTNPLGGGYEIERATGPFKVVGSVVGGVVTFIDTVAPRGTYQYRIRAISGSLVGNYSGVVTVTPPSPAAPTLQTITPDSAFENSGAKLTVQGSAFSAYSPGPNAVLFGGAPANRVTLIDGDNLTCELPAATTPPLGDLDVDIANLNGTARLSPGLTVYEWPPYFSTEAVVERGALRSTYPVICCSGETAYAIWVGDGNVFFSVSTDAGATWSQGMQIDVLSQCPGAATWLRICCDDQNVYAIWHNGSVTSDRGRIYMNSSSDGGATWLGDAEVGTFSAGPGGTATSTRTAKFPSVECSGDSVYVAWVDDRNGPDNVFLSYSADAGATWQPDTQLDVNHTGGAERVSPALALSGNNVHVVWSTDNEIRSNSSADGGATWLPNTVQVDGGFGNSLLPKVSASGDNVYVTWTNDRNSNQDVYFSRSTDGGTSYAAEQALETDPSSSKPPRVSAAGDNVYVAWSDQSGIQLRRSNDAGANFGATQQLHSGLTPASEPMLTCSDDVVAVSWLSPISNNVRAWLNTSHDGGATFQPTGEVAINSANIPLSGADFCSDGARLYAIYGDTSFDLYVNHNLPSSGR